MSITINIGYGQICFIWEFCTSNEFSEAFATASEKNKFITKTKASAKWGIGSLVFQISPRPILLTLCTSKWHMESLV